jgi:glycosyltransferase involved in cell wall biosynthesis
LNGPHVEGVGNHGRRSAHALLEFGVDRRRVVAWDWPHALRPHASPVKDAPPNGRPWQLFYAGSVDESKGVGDLLQAVAELHRRGSDAQLQIAGNGQIARYRALAESIGISSAATLLGPRPHEEVIERMRSSDIVVVPSRHEYPEGFPMTLFEALSTRTPIVASDHPMFTESLVHGRTAMVFPAGNAVALADCVMRLRAEPPLYRALSTAAVSTWEGLQVPIEWAQLVRSWFVGPAAEFDAVMEAGRRDLAAS